MEMLGWRVKAEWEEISQTTLFFPSYSFLFLWYTAAIPTWASNDRHLVFWGVGTQWNTWIRRPCAGIPAALTKVQDIYLYFKAFPLPLRLQARGCHWLSAFFQAFQKSGREMEQDYDIQPLMPSPGEKYPWFFQSVKPCGFSALPKRTLILPFESDVVYWCFSGIPA